MWIDNTGRLWPFFFIFILFLMQNFIDYLFPGNAPALLLTGVVYYSLKEGWRTGLWLGLFAGFFTEIFGQGPLGFYMAQFAAVGVLSGLLSSKLFGDSLLTEIFLPAVAVYFSALAEVVYRLIMTGSSGSWRCFALAFQIGAIAGTALFSPLLFFCLHKTSSRSSWRS